MSEVAEQVSDMGKLKTYREIQAMQQTHPKNNGKAIQQLPLSIESSMRNFLSKDVCEALGYQNGAWLEAAKGNVQHAADHLQYLVSALVDYVMILNFAPAEMRANVLRQFIRLKTENSTASELTYDKRIFNAVYDMERAIEAVTKRIGDKSKEHLQLEELRRLRNIAFVFANGVYDLLETPHDNGEKLLGAIVMYGKGMDKFIQALKQNAPQIGAPTGPQAWRTWLRHLWLEVEAANPTATAGEVRQMILDQLGTNVNGTWYANPETAADEVKGGAFRSLQGKTARKDPSDYRNKMLRQ